MTPSIACIGVIGKHVRHPDYSQRRSSVLNFQNNPLHIALFPPHLSNQDAHLEFSFLLNASLDNFETRTRDHNRVDQDLGMLQVVDERLSIWGWETGTGTKFAIVVDMWGKDGRPGTGFGVKGEDVRPVSWLRPVTITRQSNR